jgi:hypothetical protein
LPNDKVSKEKLKRIENKNSVIPLDEALGVDKLPFRMTPGFMVMACFWAQNQKSYEAAQERLNEQNYPVNDDTLRVVTNYIGKLVFDNDTKEANKSLELFNTCKLPYDLNKEGTLYIETDGAALNTRVKDNNDSSWRENKLAIVFNTDNIKFKINKDGKRESQIMKREYTSFIGKAEDFSKYVLSSAIRNGYGQYKNTVIISDGATWIRNMVDIYFKGAQQILDFYHLAEHIHNFSKEVFKNEDEKAKNWAHEMCSLLKQSKIDTVIKNINFFTKKEQVNKLINYINNNINNIDYATYISKGYFIGSGAIESSNKTILQTRLKRPGQRWNVCSAQYLLTLITKYESRLWYPDVVKLVENKFS